MKTIKLLSALLAVLFLVTSCNQNRVFEKHRKNFTDYRWESTNVCEYTPVIEDADAKYDITFALRHIYGFQHKSLNINIEMTSPSGETKSNDYNIQVVGDKREYLSDCAGDYCDLETLIEEDFKFEETGTYTFKITHLMEDDPVQAVMEVGLIIDKVVEK